MLKLSKRSLSISLIAVLWWVNSAFCFCCEEDFANTSECNISACVDEPSGPTAEDTFEDCIFCCGHQVFTVINPSVKSIELPRKEFIAETLNFSKPFNFASVYHPPKGRTGSLFSLLI